MTILKRLTFQVQNCEYNTFLSEDLFSGDIMYLSINILCSQNCTLSIHWSNDTYTLYTENYIITGSQFFNKIINVKGSYFQVEINNVLSSTYVLQTFYH